MADFTLDGTVSGVGAVTATAVRASVSFASTTTGGSDVTGGVWPSIVGLVSGQGDGINNVRGRVVASVYTTGLVPGTGVVTGLISQALLGIVTGAGSVTGTVRHTPRVFGDVEGISVLTAELDWNAVIGGDVTGASVIAGGPYPGVQPLVTGVGVLTGDFLPVYKVTGDVSGIGLVTGFVRNPAQLTGTVTGVGVLTGSVGSTSKITGTVTGTQNATGTLRLNVKITNSLVSGVGEVTGALVRERAAQSSVEGDYETTGVRKALPILVYERQALGLSSLGEVPDNGNFLVSASYVGAPGDPFYEAGAAPNAIGTKVQPILGSSYLLFRQPLENEVVWHVQEEQTYRFREDFDTGISSWKKYNTWPHRAGDGMRIFSLFDPDLIYPYYLKILGAVQYQVGYDNQVLLDQIDPDKVSRFYLPELASNYGLTLDFDDDLAVRRAKTRNAVAVAKTKGLESGVRLRLRALGYTGYVNDIWVNPTNVANFQSPVLNDNNTPTSSATGAGTDFKEYPHGYRSDDPTDGYFPSSRVAVHLNDGSGNPLQITQDIKDRVARELCRDVLPIFVDIRYFVTDVPAAEEGVEVGDELEITLI